VSFLQEKIYADTKIDIKDQILFTKKGHKLHPDDIFGNLERENNFQATISKLENMAKAVFTIYVFDQKKLSSEYRNSVRDRTQPYFMENNEELRDYLTEAKVIEKDYTSSFQSQMTDASMFETIKKSNPDAVNLESKLFGTYLRIKKKYLQYKTKVRKTERLIKESENQLQTFDVLLKHASINYNPCKNKKNEVLKRFLTNYEKNNHTLKKFEESLENLKKIELHESLKTDKQKFLLDIYFSPEAMNKWKNSCIDFQNNIKGKIEKYSTAIKTIKKRLKDERDQTINLVLGQFHAQASGADTATQEGESKVLAIFLKCYEEYKLIRETLESIGSGSSNDEDKLSNEKWKELETKDWDEEVAVCDDHIQKMDRVIEQIMRMKLNFENHIFGFYKSIMKYSAELSMISNEKMKHMNEEIDKMDKEFSYLLNPSHLPGAYQSSLAEVSRRREFALIFDKKFKKLQNLVENEKDQRKRFLAQYGRILPCEFIPQLKHMPPTLTAENLDTDIGLPKIEGFHKTEKGSEEKLDKKQTEEFDRINREYKQEVQKLKEDSDSKTLRRKLEELTKDFENEKERTKVLRMKLNDLEKHKMTKSLKDGGSKEFESLTLREEFDQLARLSTGVLSSIENYSENQGSLKSGKENFFQASSGEKGLAQKVTVLNGLVQQLTKSSFDIFCRKLNEKQRKYDESRAKYENLLMKVEDDLQRQGTQIASQYEEKLQDITQKYNEAQRVIRDLLDELKRTQEGVVDQKNESQEKCRAYQIELEQARKDIKVKLDMLKSKDDMIKVLNEGRNAHMKQISEFKDKMEQFEQKIKLEHSEVLTNIHNLHKQDIEKLKEKIKGLENGVANKTLEIEKVKASLNYEQKEGKRKEEVIRKLETEVENLKEELEKAQYELKGYQNKIENMDIVMKNKSGEADEKEKRIQELFAEKKLIAEDLSTYKEVNNELNKNIIELKKRKEAEKNTLIAENEKLLFEIEKKKVEINNLTEQIEQMNKETKAKMEALSKFAEDQNAEKLRIESLTEELNDKNIEINTLKTKNELFSLDLENKMKENIYLEEKLEMSKWENDKLTNELQTSGDALAAERNTIRDLKQKLEDINTINEQLRIEIDIKNKQSEELEKDIAELNDKILKAKENLEKLRKENELMRKQTQEKEKRDESNTQELSKQISLLEKERGQKNIEIEDLTSKNQDFKEEIAKMKDRIEWSSRSLEEKEDTIQNLQDEIKNNQNITSEMEKQEVWYKEEVKSKQQEVEKLREKIELLSQQFEKLNKEYFVLNNELEIQKENAETVSLTHHRQLSSKLDYLRLEKGSRVLFIPYNSGVYVPFSLHQYTPKEIESILKKGTANLAEEVFTTVEKSVKTNFFLDLDDLSQAYQDILRNFSLLIVATVKDIKKKMNKEINPDQESLMIEVEKVEYMMGFDDEEEMLLKNYVI